MPDGSLVSTPPEPCERNEPAMSRTGIVVATVVALLLGGTTGISAVADMGPAGTRAALDPALVAGRGATVGFVEQEAETAHTDGTVIGPGTDAYTLAAEASGRSAVSLAPGQFVEFTLPRAANAITVRYSIPDAPTGGGIGRASCSEVKLSRRNLLASAARKSRAEANSSAVGRRESRRR